MAENRRSVFVFTRQFDGGVCVNKIRRECDENASREAIARFVSSI